MLFTAVNPNKVGIKYGESKFTVMYHGIPLGKALVPGFYQEAHSERQVEATISVDRYSLLQANAAELIRDASLNDKVELRVLGEVHGEPTGPGPILTLHHELYNQDRMDRYQRVEKPKAETAINENELRITAQGRMRNYISYALSLFQDKGTDEVVLKATGRAINKTVMIAELLKISAPIPADQVKPLAEYDDERGNSNGVVEHSNGGWDGGRGYVSRGRGHGRGRSFRGRGRGYGGGNMKQKSGYYNGYGGSAELPAQTRELVGQFKQLHDWQCQAFEFAAEGIPFQDEWPYPIHLLGHIYVNDINSARFLWKSIPSAIKESQPEVAAAWRIGQRLWTRDYAGVYEAIRGFDWSQETRVLVAAFSEVYTKRMFQLLLSAYSTISIEDTARFLGMNEDDAANYVLQPGWTVDPASRMLTVKKQLIVTEQKLDSSKLQRLTEYVFHLEH
ncbi:hypothetical protein GH714_004372 [Hevea brasiliensis]|uniref:DNA/RNA-binding protein Alba-like domain-containing protein n=1 Tax=Hevea brasiliensis TaxID=3981 RepID=A0A6A6L0M3_HEVBR|nr:hypothetical protein GH714_004372 [Hevea brasiliensis]